MFCRWFALRVALLCELNCSIISGRVTFRQSTHSLNRFDKSLLLVIRCDGVLESAAAFFLFDPLLSFSEAYLEPYFPRRPSKKSSPSLNRGAEKLGVIEPRPNTFAQSGHDSALVV